MLSIINSNGYGSIGLLIDIDKSFMLTLLFSNSARSHDHRSVEDRERPCIDEGIRDQQEGNSDKANQQAQTAIFAIACVDEST